MVAFLSYVVSFYEPINRLTEIDNIFQEAIAAGERIFELLDEEAEIVDGPDAVELPPIEGGIIFEHVHFRYGAGCSLPILRLASAVRMSLSNHQKSVRCCATSLSTCPPAKW